MQIQIKKKIIIYDTSRGFHRFMKLNFANDYEVDSVFDFKGIKDIDFDEYSAIFFIINESTEVFDLIALYSKGKSIFVGTRLSNTTESLQNIEGITIIDLIQSRQQMVDFIHFHLKIFAISE